MSQEKTYASDTCECTAHPSLGFHWSRHPLLDSHMNLFVFVKKAESHTHKHTHTQDKHNKTVKTNNRSMTIRNNLSEVFL